MEHQPIELDSETAELTVGNTDAVRFLDAAGLDAVGVIGQIGIALSLMPCDGVLSVHSDDPAARNAVAVLVSLDAVAASLGDPSRRAQHDIRDLPHTGRRRQLIRSRSLVTIQLVAWRASVSESRS